MTISKFKYFTLMVFASILLSALLFGQELELMQKFNPNLPASGRNASLIGRVVSNIGDIDGDDYDDWAFGFPDAANINTTKKVGKVYIYLGSSSLASEQDPDFILQGENDGDRFGTSISSADINNDGYNDVIVGANGNSLGKVYIYFGSTAIDTIADAVLTSSVEGEGFGRVVSSAGDVNNDNYEDILVHAPRYDLDDIGHVYVFYGGETIDNIVDITLTAPLAGDDFGCEISSAGDVNNDGYDDILIGERYNDYPANSAGRAYIYFGAESMDTIADVIFTAKDSNDNLGFSVSSAGDVNNDKYADVIVGARVAGDNSQGEAYIYFGGASMDSIADVTLTGEESHDYFGKTVSCAGDVNNDGYSDVIVGADYTDAGGTEIGRAYVYFGGVAMDMNADVTMTGEADRDHFGGVVSSAGDINGDGYTDVVVGAQGNDGGGSGSGRAYIYYGGEKMNNTMDLIFTGELSSDWFGCSVSSAGDVNNDGYDDVAIAAKWNDEGGGNAGRVYIYFGGSSIDNETDIILTGQEEGIQFGTSVSSAGDVNNDGFDDLIVGMDKYGTGKAFLYYGGTSMDDIADLIFTSGVDNDGFGKSVSSAGDVNNDGFEDIIVGADGFPGNAYIFYGGLIMDDNIDLILPGISTGSRFGCSVASAGDLNNDGYDDVIVGACGNNSMGVLAGRAYIYFGGAEMDSIVDLILSGETDDDNFGVSVSSAGDVNDDGYADVIVGAYNNAEGRAYIFFGGSSMNNTPDIVFKGEADQDHFGISVSNAGDVNYDGHSDILIGAEYNGAGGRYAGRAYIYFGGESIIDTVADIILTGEAITDYFGHSVSCAGDINDDGISDVVIGAYGNNAVGAQMGRAYLYAGVDLSDINFNSKNQLLDQFLLYQNYPNPFNPVTVISWQLTTSTHVELNIYNILGEKVRTLVNKKYVPGRYEYVFDASGLAAGLYFYRIKTDQFMKTKRMILIK
jgi:hypothetical protein